MDSVFRFGFILFTTLLFIFFIHTSILFYLDLPIFDHQIVKAYWVNFLLALGIYAYITASKKKYNDQLGFLYMAGSLLKFAVFFIFFYPSYKADNQLESIEFISFFVPYLVCLVLETLGLVRILKN